MQNKSHREQNVIQFVFHNYKKRMHKFKQLFCRHGLETLQTDSIKCFFLFFKKVVFSKKVYRFLLNDFFINFPEEI